MRKFAIPTSFCLGSREYQVWYDPEQINRKDSTVGTMSLGTGQIFMQTPIKDKLDELAINQAFFHELVHGILYSMGESELVHNERFVDGMAHMLIQYELTKEGNLLKIWKDEKRAAKK